MIFFIHQYVANFVKAVFSFLANLPTAFSHAGSGLGPRTPHMVVKISKCVSWRFEFIVGAKLMPDGYGSGCLEAPMYWTISDQK